MFDWNDEELANIIWDEGGESDDHIVPFPEASEDLRNKKEVNQEAAACKLTKRKQPETNTDCHENLGSSSNVNNSGGLLASGYGASSWPDSSLSSAAKIDQGSMGTELSKNREETTQHEKDAQFFQNAEEGKEQGDFVDYDWANIGSFDDLDRIFSHDDPIFGNVSLDNSDELWSAKDVSNNQAHVPLDAPSPTDALRNKSEPFEIKEEHGHCNDQSFSPSYEKISGPAYQSIQNSHTTTDNVECAGDRSKPTGKEQQSLRKKNQLNTRKKSQIKQEEKDLQDFYGNWSSSATLARQFENQLTPSVLQSSPSSILGQPNKLQGPETLYQNIINPYAAPSVYGNLTNTYPAMPMLSQIQSGNLRHQPVLSGYETSLSSVNALKSYAGSINPQTMTPQEKIEKLRRRQQMQAMLAIQKQQQVLGHQVPSTSKSVAQKCHPEIQSHLSDGTDPKIEDLSGAIISHSFVVSDLVSFHFSVKMSIGETACSYALLILEDDNIPATADNITSLLKSAKVEVESFWPALFAKLAEKKNIRDLIANAAGGGGGAVAVAAAPAAAAAAAPAAAEKKEEPKEEEESDEEMGFGLFDE